MSATPWPQGLMTALVTPLADDRLDIGALDALIERQIDAGVAGLVIGGGTGEYGALSIQERLELGREAIRIVAGRVAAIVQTGALATRDTIMMSQDAQDAGASGLLVASPFGEPINWRERFDFYQRVNAAVDLPIMLYNTPPSGIMTLPEIDQLAQLSNVSAVKDSSGSRELMAGLIEWATSADFGVYVGMDTMLYDAVSSGARGAIFGAANLVPDLIARLLTDLQRTGSTSATLALWGALQPFLSFMERSPNYMALCKAGCKLEGIDVGNVRSPYLDSDPAEIAELALRLTELRQAFAS